jgi:hypothetical protein
MQKLLEENRPIEAFALLQKSGAPNGEPEREGDSRIRTAFCDPELEAAVLTHMGFFREASRAYAAARQAKPEMAPSIGEAEAFAFAGDNATAASVLHALFEKQGKDVPDSKKAMAASLSCIELAYGRRAGQPSAVEALQQIAASQLVADKPIVWEDPRTFPKSKLPRACRAMLDAFSLSGWQSRGPWISLYGVERGDAYYRLDMSGLGQRKYHGSMGLLIAPVEQVMHTPMPLFQSSLDAMALRQKRQMRDDNENSNHQRGEPVSEWNKLERSELAVPVAAYMAFMGELESARSLLREHVDPTLEVVTKRTQAIDSSDYNRPEFEVLRRAAAVALRAEDYDLATRYIDASDSEGHAAAVLRQWMRQVKPGGAYEKPFEDSTWGKNAEMLESTTDTREIAKLLKQTGTGGRQVLARIRPRVPARDAHLVAWYKHDFPMLCTRCGIWQLAEHVGDRRHAARMLGLEEDEKQWAEVAKRVNSAVLTRNGAEEWLALEELFAPELGY